jgi:GNAT superfamily N-acetyltransferase
MVEIRTLEQCDQSCLQQYIELVDQVFIRDRFRSGSMLYRYPGLFVAENWRNLFTTWHNHRLIGTAAVKEVVGTLRGFAGRGAMVGLVAVQPEFRGRGFGAALISTVSNTLASRDLDFSVLWTTSPDFYASSGWFPSDCGLFGQLENSGWLECSPPTQRVSDCLEEIERIRKLWQPMNLVRTELDYSAVPPSVDGLTCFTAGGADGCVAYAMVGVRGKTGSVYEVVGDSEFYPDLWDQIAAHFSIIYVNDWEGSTSFEWLRRNTRLVWKRQSLAMWMIRENPSMPGVGAMHIPYFDRI